MQLLIMALLYKYRQNVQYDHASVSLSLLLHYLRRPLIKIPLLPSIITVFVEFASECSPIRLTLNRMASHVFVDSPSQ